jgi:hypothetical protein
MAASRGLGIRELLENLWATHKFMPLVATWSHFLSLLSRSCRFAIV